MGTLYYLLNFFITQKLLQIKSIQKLKRLKTIFFLSLTMCYIKICIILFQREGSKSQKKGPLMIDCKSHITSLNNLIDA